MIRVVAGDLAQQAVDAVLRPADASLAPVGPAAARLDACGGDRLAAERRTATPLETGAAVVTGAGDLAAPYVLHVVIVDERGPAGRERIRRALVSAWQRAAAWGLRRVAVPLVGVAGGQLTLEECITLLVETLPAGPEHAGPERAMELTIMAADAAECQAVEALVRRLT